jgi:hypothetical protein
MDVAIFDNKKIQFTIGAENSLLGSKNDADVDAIIARLEQARNYFYSAKSLKNKALVMQTYEIHYKHFRIVFKLQNTYIEVLSILNSYVFPPNGNPVYETF